MALKKELSCPAQVTVDPFPAALEKRRVPNELRSTLDAAPNKG